MGDGGDLLLALTRHIGKANVALVLANRIAQALSDGKRAVERAADMLAKRRASRSRRGIGNGRMAHQVGDIGDNVLPDLVHICLDTPHKLCIHKRDPRNQSSFEHVTPTILPV